MSAVREPQGQAYWPLVLDRLEALEEAVSRLADDKARNVTSLWADKREMAQRLGVSVSWLEKRMPEGLPHRLVGGKVQFQPSVVDAWLKKHGHVKEIG